MVKVTPLVKKPQIKKRTATFFRMHSNRFMRVPVSWQAACGDEGAWGCSPMPHAPRPHAPPPLLASPSMLRRARLADIHVRKFLCPLRALLPFWTGRAHMFPSTLRAVPNC